jgi:5-methylcytosine-specific restriction endonuclease McrA
MAKRPWASSHGRSGSGGFPPRIRRAILTRDGWQCTHVDPHTGERCTATERLEVDHVVSQADARRLGWTPAEIHDPANGVTLCAPHHAARTRAQATAGRARARAARPRRRPPERHPGLR